MSSFFIGAKTRVLKGKAAPKGKGGKGRVFPREKPYPERVITKNQNSGRVIHLNQKEFNHQNQHLKQKHQKGKQTILNLQISQHFTLKSKNTTDNIKTFKNKKEM
ncbi:hypothetical protein ACBZ90_17630 (plasmid) [Vibrio alginolyticus]